MTELVTPHFALDEFACRDGSPYPVTQIDTEDPWGLSWFVTRLKPLCETLEVIRHAAGDAQGLHIDSGYRSLEYDAKLYRQSAKNGLVAPPSRSQHPQGRAADITRLGMLPSELFNLVLELYAEGRLPKLGGLGLYPTFIHVDVRTRPVGHLAIWGGHRPSNVA